MPERTQTTRTLKDNDAWASASIVALAETCKALKAFSFYPQNHPLREKILQSAYQAMSDLAKERTVSLIVQRNGFSFADQRISVENTPMTRALAQELFARELQRLTVLPDLSLSEFTGFLSLLAIEPQKIVAAGGLAGLLTKHGIQTVIVNEIDISAVFTRKTVDQASDEAVGRGTRSVEEYQEDIPSDASPPDHLNDLSIEELLDLMSSEAAGHNYRLLARVLRAKGQTLRLEGEFDRLFNVIAALVKQNGDPAKNLECRECALIVLQQLAQGDMTAHFLDHLEEDDFGRQEMVFLILNRLGVEAVEPVIGRLIAAGSKPSRKALVTALLQIGPPAEPALIALLADNRWQVVHSAVAILGEMGSKEAIRHLALTVSHLDNRVRMESIRSLARIGGMEASNVLIELLQDENQAIVLQAITWLGNTRNQRALQPLLQIAQKRDFLGKIQPLKKEALAAVGRIGDRRALEPLLKLVRTRFFIFPSRGDELKFIAVDAIGNLGGEPAREFLEKTAARSGPLRRACTAALETMARRPQESQ